MSYDRNDMHREELEQRRFELESKGYNYTDAKMLAKQQIIHDHDPQDEET